MSETIVYVLAFHQETRRGRRWHRDLIGAYSSLDAAKRAADLDDLADDDEEPDAAWPRPPLTWHRDVQCSAADDVRWTAWGNADNDDTDNRPWPRSRFYDILPFYLDGNYVPASAIPE